MDLAATQQLKFAEDRLLNGILNGEVLSEADRQDPASFLEKGYLLGGYQIQGEPGTDQAQVYPALAGALASRWTGAQLHQIFHELWAVDMHVWQRLDQADHKELAELWMESPARRLSRDVAHISSQANDPSANLDAIWRCAGISGDKGQHPAGWLQLHEAVPGDALLQWAPQEPLVPTALGLLDDGSPVFLRGAALGWLLDRTVDNPVYEVGSLRRSLQEELPARLASALSSPARLDIDLERWALLHAAIICQADKREGATRRCWSLSRWLLSCLVRSPFFSTNKESLAAHLRAQLPKTPIIQGTDPLHPSRFYRRGGMDPYELGILSGILRHYGQSGHPTLALTPLPLVEALRRMVNRLPSPAEEEAETNLAKGLCSMGWSAPHVAPPLCAGWLMTHLKIGFLGQMEEEARGSLVRRFTADPERHAWLPFAIDRERPSLSETFREGVADAFRRIGPGCRPSPHAAALLAAAAFPHLSSPDKELALRLVQEAEPTWRPSVLGALADAAEQPDPPDLGFWAQVIDSLLSLTRDKRLDRLIRQEAGLVALRHVVSRPDEKERLQLILSVLTAPPFVRDPDLRKELRSLGLLPARGGMS